MRRELALVVVVACQQTTPLAPTPATPTPTRVDAALLPDATIALVPNATDCMSDELRWGTTCCRPMGEIDGERRLECRGPQLGKTCHKKSDCDIACSCDRKWAHHDGKLGLTGTCTGDKPDGVWLCELDDNGAVTSLIID